MDVFCKKKACSLFLHACWFFFILMHKGDGQPRHKPKDRVQLRDENEIVRQVLRHERSASGDQPDDNDLA